MIIRKFRIAMSIGRKGYMFCNIHHGITKNAMYIDNGITLHFIKQ